MKTSLIFFFILCLTLHTHGSALAQHYTLSDPNVPIAVHEVRPSGVKIVIPSTEQVINTSNSSPLPGMVYTSEESELPPGAGTFDSLPPCTSSDIRRTTVFHHSKGSDLLDIVFYSPLDSEQVAKAKAWPGIAEAFLEGSLYNPYYKGYDTIQCLSRTLRVKCLPTRFHYTTVDGIRVSEYREGERAWDRD